MNILVIFILILISLISIAILLYHFSRVFSDEGFPENIPVIPTFYLPILLLVSILRPLLEKFIDKYNNFIFIYSILLHLLAFMIIYSVILLIIQLIQLIESKIKIFPNNHIIYTIKFKKNTKILKSAFVISYFLSTLVFIFVIRNFMLTVLVNNGVDISLIKDEFKAYYELFILSFVPILHSYLKNQKS